MIDLITNLHPDPPPSKVRQWTGVGQKKMFKRSNVRRGHKLPQSYKRISGNFMTHLSVFDILWHFPRVHAGQEEWIRVNFRTPQMFQDSTNVHWCTNGWHWLHLLRLSGFNLLFRLSQFCLHFLDAILGIPHTLLPASLKKCRLGGVEVLSFE